MNRFGLGEEPEVHEIEENTGHLTEEDLHLAELDEIIQTTFGPLDTYLGDKVYADIEGIREEDVMNK